MNNREYERDNMIFHLVVNTHFTEEQLNGMSDGQLRLHYDYFVGRESETVKG